MAGLVDFSIGDIGQVLVRAREALTGERITDPLELAKISLQLSKVEQMANQGQIAVNKIEAAHKSLFVAGWRPFIGWVCGVAIAYAFVLQPLIEWAIVIMHVTYSVPDGAGGFIDIPVETPKLNVDTLYQLVLAMLGMAGLRTYEKSKKIAREK